MGVFIIKSINFGYSNGQLSITQRQGIITCISKGDKPKHFLQNWRPISLLNIVYKITSGTIANRLKTVLDKLINKDQTGFLSGRYIGENTRLMYDVMHYTEENDIPGMLLTIDFEKAFDSVSWKFINKVLQFFGFGNSIINWITILYKNISSAVNQGGKFVRLLTNNERLSSRRPNFTVYFILCAEILAIRLRNNSKIKSINVDNCPILVSQYADDTCLILDGSEMSLKESIIELKGFARISGLKINTGKTQVIWIGSKRYSEDTILPELNLHWGKEQFTILGI